jgi:predicted  nucleic acid-binding Zn-ribbon protein
LNNHLQAYKTEIENNKEKVKLLNIEIKQLKKQYSADLERLQELLKK